jgi:hypothetical protein
MAKPPTITKSIKMPVSLLRRIELLATAESNTVSGVIRRVLTDALETEETKKERRAS